MSVKPIDQIPIHSSWKVPLKEEFEKPYFAEIKNALKQEKAQGISIFPRSSDILRAFQLCSFDNLKVVILGQDPYHGPGQAHGLCFSVPSGIPFPPSLENIFKELKADTGKVTPETGDLSRWAEQGVFLLNAMLTVRAHQPGSHHHIGWQQFTDKLISIISEKCSGVVFMLWGAFAQKKAILINPQNHLLLQSPHPSPLSAYRGFFGNKHFSKANNFLLKNAKQAIVW